MLVRDVAAEFDGRVKVLIEEYGNSEMAARFGVRRYPVVFVDDVLMARPKDFGFGGDDDTSGGLYVPWLDPASQRRFKDDLRRAVARRLAGKSVKGPDIADVTSSGNASDAPPRLPDDTFQRSHSEVVVLALAVDSNPDDVQKLAASIAASYHVIFGTPELVKAFGATAAIPKLMIFGPSGQRAEVIYGAPPDLHQQIERAVASAATR